MDLFKKNSEPKLQPQPAYMKKDRVAEYQASKEDFSYKELKLAAWYISHKVLLQKIGVSLIIAWCVLSLGYSGFRWGEYLIFGYWEDLAMVEKQVSEVQNYEAQHLLSGAQDLRIDRVQIFDHTGEKYDFVTMAQNPNERWIAQISFKYTYAAGETEAQEAVLLPGEETPLAVLGFAAEAYPSQVTLEILDINWDKISAHRTKDVKSYLNERLMFELGQVKFTRPSRSELPTSQLQFFLTNNSAYSYWQPAFYIILLDGSRMEGLVNLTLEQFRTGDEKEVDLRFLDTSINVTDVKVVPAINVFDKSVFMEP